MRFLRSALLLAFLAPGLQAQTLKATFVVGGLARPSWVGAVPGDSRVFALEQDGRVRIVQGSQLLATPFLDINPIVGSLGNEQGLLGMAFDPNYASNGFFYVSYTDNNGASVVARYTNQPPSSNSADPASAQLIFGPLAQPQSNHNGGCIRFGPDGMLYLGLGDGGAANDTGAGHDALVGNGQSMSTYLGKLLRIDPANPAVPPAGNPFPTSAVPLAWDLGLRNPWRFSFDSATGELYLGDVGQNAWEELDVEPAGAGGNDYGWRCMEGSHCTGLTGCSCGAAGLVLPVHEYAHTSGNCAIIGGDVYRGQGIPLLQGAYIFGDYCSGRIWTLVYSGGQVTQLTDRTAQLAPGIGHSIANPVAFGSDGLGEILVLDQAGGEIYRVGETCTAPTTYCQAGYNSTGFPANITFTGNGSLLANNLNISAITCPPSVTGLFIYGNGQQLTVLGNGWLCIASGLVRGPVIQTNAFGDANWHPDLPTLQGAGPGIPKNFQFWYRDPLGGGAQFNLSDALHVILCN